jgi:aerobic-type carbon monoxide dehydrogenase small subunit (CoxS/CutS family)
LIEIEADAVFRVTCTVNGRERRARVEPRRLLCDFLRHDLGLTGTHVGCEHGVCGACTVRVDGRAVRSCLMFAIQVDGREIKTIEGLAATDGEFSDLQQAFHEKFALQCGYCTPGFLMSLDQFLEDNPAPSEGEVRVALSGNICRCTGYREIVEAALLTAERRRQAAG